MLYLHKEMARAILTCVSFPGVVGFLKFLMLTGQLPHDIDYKNPISSLLVGSAVWKETAFDQAHSWISRMQVDALFLSLTASGILQLNQKDTSLQWGIAREYASANNNDCFIEAHIGIPIYNRDDARRGVNLFSKNHVRKKNQVHYQQLEIIIRL